MRIKINVTIEKDFSHLPASKLESLIQWYYGNAEDYAMNSDEGKAVLAREIALSLPDDFDVVSVTDVKLIDSLGNEITQEAKND